MTSWRDVETMSSLTQGKRETGKEPSHKAVKGGEDTPPRAMREVRKGGIEWSSRRAIAASTRQTHMTNTSPRSRLRGEGNPPLRTVRREMCWISCEAIRRQRRGGGRGNDAFNGIPRNRQKGCLGRGRGNPRESWVGGGGCWLAWVLCPAASGPQARNIPLGEGSCWLFP
jgi:hypothetical protein